MTGAIKIIEIVDPSLEEVIEYVCRGHVPERQFVSQLEAQFEQTGEAESVRHGYRRWIPAAGPELSLLILVATPGRGAWPATFIDADDVGELTFQ